MTLQNLNKILDKYEQQQLGIANTPSQQLELLKGLPFYTEWQAAPPSVQKSSLSFNHAIGLPRKNGQELPLFDYEREEGTSNYKGTAAAILRRSTKSLSQEQQEHRYSWQ